MECISYKKGYKYQLVEEYSVDIPIAPENDIKSEYTDLSSEGNLITK